MIELTFHQCGLSLLVLYSALNRFSPNYSGFPLASKTINFIWLNLIRIELCVRIGIIAMIFCSLRGGKIH